MGKKKEKNERQIVLGHSAKQLSHENVSEHLDMTHRVWARVTQCEQTHKLCGGELFQGHQISLFLWKHIFRNLVSL